ncbi:MULTISPECIES: hypothetical protein [unclassified Polaribacter]|uniref:hypothetical protein n=1 Tax=unclassified Polaribacter TaxID=196858 RepID=UPI0011BF8373|nr:MULTISPECIES: hypothetical protein [unclassified Polaribacter]TXD54182.1 hypothetical protein ES043_01405 [Polaribacter sp. IC063]TXD62447.1 hypothetical protein ES044_01615 [Polaribacter sp. IC066]
MKTLLCLLFLVITLACSSNKKIVKNCKLNPFEQLDSIQTSKVILKYEVALPKSWKKSTSSNADWYFIEKAYLDSLGFQATNADLYIRKFKIKKECNSRSYDAKSFLDFYVSYRSKWFIRQPFNYILLKSKHPIYGDFYIIKYKWAVGNFEYTASSFLLMHNNEGYLLEYRNNSKNFDIYLMDVQKIVQSFKIAS